MHRHCRPIRWCGRYRAFNLCRIQTIDHTLSHTCRGKIREKNALQTLLINLPIFEGFIQAVPLTLKGWWKRQFWKGLRLCFGDQGIHGVEQGIFGSAKTSIDVVTKVLQCAKIHASKAPNFFFLLYSPRPFFAKGKAFRPIRPDTMTSEHDYEWILVCI